MEDSQKCHTFALANREHGALDEWLSLRSAKPSTAVRIRQAPPKIEQSQKAALFFIHFANAPFRSPTATGAKVHRHRGTKPPLNVEHVISRDVHESENDI